MASALVDCPDCGKQVSVSALTCPGCGKPLLPKPPAEGPYLRTKNAITVGILWLIGIPLAFAVLVGLVEGIGALWEGVRRSIGP